MDTCVLTPPSSPVHSLTSSLEEPSTPTHQRIPDPRLQPPGAPRKPRSLKRWTPRENQDSLDLRDYFLGLLPIAHDLDLNPANTPFEGLPGTDEVDCFEELLPAYAGSMFTAPFISDDRVTGRKMSSPKPDVAEGKKRRLNDSTFNASGESSLLEPDTAPDWCTWHGVGPPTPYPSFPPVPSTLPLTPPSSASTGL